MCVCVCVSVCQMLQLGLSYLSSHEQLEKRKAKLGRLLRGLKPLVSCHGLSVTTVEGVGSERKCLHQVQKRIAPGARDSSFFCLAEGPLR